MNPVWVRLLGRSQLSNPSNLPCLFKKIHLNMLPANLFSHNCHLFRSHSVDTLKPRQNGRHFQDVIFKYIFLNQNVRIPINISLKFIPKGPINNIPALVQIMAGRRPGDKPLSETVLVSLLTHICVTRPQWIIHVWVSSVTGGAISHSRSGFRHCIFRDKLKYLWIKALDFSQLIWYEIMKTARINKQIRSCGWWIMYFTSVAVYYSNQSGFASYCKLHIAFHVTMQRRNRLYILLCFCCEIKDWLL